MVTDTKVVWQGFKKVNDKKVAEKLAAKREVLARMREEQEARIERRREVGADQRRIILDALWCDCDLEDALKAARVSKEMYEIELLADDDFMLEANWAMNKTKLIAKKKVLEGLEKDKTGKFALEYLKSRYPKEYGKVITENKSSSADVQVKIDSEMIKKAEWKDLDDMLKMFYTQDNL